MPRIVEPNHEIPHEEETSSHEEPMKKVLLATKFLMKKVPIDDV